MLAFQSEIYEFEISMLQSFFFYLKLFLFCFMVAFSKLLDTK